MIRPLIKMFGVVNTVATVYFVGQIGWSGYKAWRKAQKDRATSEEIKSSFVKAYTESTGEPPTDNLIEVVLKSHNATSFEAKVKDKIKSNIKKCKDSASELFPEIFG